jgi:hypothetical protein
MAKIYQLMIDDEQIRDLYYNESDAIENATQIAIDEKQTVAIWAAEEVEGVPVDALEWSISRVV